MKPEKRHQIDDSHEPAIGNDPMSLPQTTVEKQMVSPDPEKVKQARKNKAGFQKEKRPES